MTHNRRNHENITLSNNGKTIDDPKQISDDFNEYFIRSIDDIPGFLSIKNSAIVAVMSVFLKVCAQCTTLKLRLEIY